MMLSKKLTSMNEMMSCDPSYLGKVRTVYILVCYSLFFVGLHLFCKNWEMIYINLCLSSLFRLEESARDSILMILIPYPRNSIYERLELKYMPPCDGCWWSQLVSFGCEKKLVSLFLIYCTDKPLVLVLLLVKISGTKHAEVMFFFFFCWIGPKHTPRRYLFVKFKNISFSLFIINSHSLRETHRSDVDLFGIALVDNWRNPSSLEIEIWLTA